MSRPLSKIVSCEKNHIFLGASGIIFFFFFEDLLHKQSKKVSGNRILFVLLAFALRQYLAKNKKSSFCFKIFF